MTVLRGARVGVALVLALLLGAAAPATAEPAGTVTVTPSTDLIDDQVVEVHGEGWRPGSFLVIAQCDARATSFAGCDDSAASVIEGHGESFTVELRVERGVNSSRYGAIDCASAPGACIVAVLYRPGRILASDDLAFDPEGPRPDPPFQIELDLARSVRVGPDGRRAMVDARISCRPGMHVEVWVQVSQENGEDDVHGSGHGILHRCHGATALQVEVRVFEGELVSGHGVIAGYAFGFAGGDGPLDETDDDFEFVRATFVR